MTCRDEILSAAREIVSRKGVNRFSPKEIVNHMRRAGSHYKEPVIRTHVVSRMCRNAPKHHAKKYDDFERIDYGSYRLVQSQPN